MGGALADGVLGDFGADGDPVDPRRQLDAAVGLDSQLVAGGMVGVHELCVVSGQEDGVLPVARVDPALGRRRVEVAHRLAVALDCLAGHPGPHPGDPAEGDRRGDQVAAAGRKRPRGAFGSPLLLDRREWIGELRKQRFRLPVAGVTGRQERGRVVEVPVGKGNDFESCHARSRPRQSRRLRSSMSSVEPTLIPAPGAGKAGTSAPW